MGKLYKTQAGDSLKTIAKNNGFLEDDWREIYDYDHFELVSDATFGIKDMKLNEAFRSRNRYPPYVGPDQIIYIPDNVKKTMTVEGGKTYRLTVRRHSDPEPLKDFKLRLGSNATLPDIENTVGKIYVPSCRGGILNLAPEFGEIQLHYKDGKEFTSAIGQEIRQGAHMVTTQKVRNENAWEYQVPKDKHGWYFVRVVKAEKDCPLKNSFIQSAIAKDSDGTDLVPWNFWYFPYSNFGSSPHGWDNPGPFTRLHRRFSIDGLPSADAFEWEKKNHHYDLSEDGLSRAWEGHCHGATMASILFKQPEVQLPDYFGYSQEDLELFATEYAQTHTHIEAKWHLPGERNSNLHKAIPVKGKDDTDAYVHVFHEAITQVISNDKNACMMDVRANPPDRNDRYYIKNLENSAIQVWNQAVYKYQAVFYEHPDSGNNEKDIYLENHLAANVDNPRSNNSDPENGAKTKITAKYRLVFNDDGNVDPGNAKQDWEAFLVDDKAHFAPRYIYTVKNLLSRNPDGNLNVKFMYLDKLGIKRRKKYETLTTPD